VARWQPTGFDLVDATLPALGLAEDGPAGPGLLTSDTVDDMASAWCRRLLAVGRPGRGVLWLTEEPDGARRVQAMVRAGAVVAPFVAAALGGLAADRAAQPVVPRLPDPEALAGLPLLHRRALLLAAHVTASYVRYRDEWLLSWPLLRPETAALVSDAVERCAKVLDEDDPVPLQLAAYAAYLRVWDQPRSRPSPAAAASAVAALVASQQEVAGAWRAGRLDPGAAAYLLEIGVAALDDAARHGDGDAAVAVRASAGRWWTAILLARGLPERITSIDAVNDAQLFHLQHYAAWLARSGQRADLQRALLVQARVAQVRADVARGEPTAYAAKSAAARAGYELAAEIATDLVLATPAPQHKVRSQAAHTAAQYARAVLADPSTRGLLLRAGAQPAAARAAAAVARAFSVAATHGVTLGAEELAGALVLIDAVLAAGDGDPAVAGLRGWRGDLLTPMPGAR
jgi:hypothetical protein